MLILGLACWWEGPVSGAAIRCVHVCHAAPIQYPQVNLTARKCILCVCVCVTSQQSHFESCRRIKIYWLISKDNL